ALRLRRAADGERAVIACAVTDERVDDVEVGRIAGPDQTVREVVRMRAAALPRYRVDRFDAVRAHFVEALRRERHDLALFHAGLELGGDVLIDAVHHAR